jgi:hypothetical protein
MPHQPSEPTSSTQQPVLPTDPRDIMQMFGDLHARMQELANQNQHLQDSVAHLAAQNNTLRTTTPAENPFPTGHRNQVKLNKPPEFDGRDKRTANTFLTHLQLHFLATPHLFPNDRSKVLFASTYLRGHAFAWIEPHLLKQDDPIIQSWDAFQEAFLNSLGDPDRERTLTRDLQALIQTGSAAVYTTEFFRLSAFLGWNDQALQAQYYAGLKPEVKDALALSDKTLTTVQDLANFAIRIDNRLFERRQENRRNPNLMRHTPMPTTTPRTPTPSPAGPTPMVLDANRPRFQSLSPDERQHRIRNGLCLYCGQKGHMAIACPNHRSRRNPQTTQPLQAASTSAALSESENALAQALEDASV